MTHRKPYFDKNDYIDRDIVLCETTNFRAGKHVAKALNMESISFSKRWKPIPLLLRPKYKGADELCIISINRNEYTKARRALSHLAPCFFNRLEINVI